MSKPYNVVAEYTSREQRFQTHRMSIASLIKQIRSLPFNDMMMVAEELRDRLKDKCEGKIEALVLAEILARLQIKDVPLAEMAVEEEKVLRQVFSRQRTINIKRLDKGWNIDVPTLPGSQVMGTELRPMFAHMLDQIITIHVLGKK